MIHDEMMALAEIHARLARIDKLLKISNSKFDREIMRHLHDNQRSLTTLIMGIILGDTDGDQSDSKEEGRSSHGDLENATGSRSEALTGSVKE